MNCGSIPGKRKVINTFSITYRPAVGFTKPRTQLVLGVQRQRIEAEDSPTSSAGLRLLELYTVSNTSSYRNA
jgi:hypothetical protein